MNAKHNILLGQLSDAAYQRFEPHLQLVALTHQDKLCVAGQGLSEVYFPLDASLALQHELPNGCEMQTALIAQDGMLGTGLLCDGPYFDHALVHTPGHAYRMPLQSLMDVATQDDEVMLQFYGEAVRVFQQMARNLACQSRHALLSRVAKALLTGMVKPEADASALANCLGATPQAIAQALADLQAAQALELDGERIARLNPEHLQRLACACVTDAAQSLM